MIMYKIHILIYQFVRYPCYLPLEQIWWTNIVFVGIPDEILTVSLVLSLILTKVMDMSIYIQSSWANVTT